MRLVLIIPTKKPRNPVHLVLKGRKGGKMKNKRREAAEKPDRRLEE